MDEFRLKAFYILHEETIHYVLGPWVETNRDKTFMFQSYNHVVLDRAIERGFEAPKEFHNSPGSFSAGWAPLWRFYRALRAKGWL